jgi:predicted RNase H-like HicB family nuclease
MIENFAYPASVVPDEAGFYLVTFPDFPKAATVGESREEVIEEASGALAEAIAVV